MVLVSVSKILIFAFCHLIVSGVRCSSCLWLGLVPPASLLASVSAPGSPTLSKVPVVRALSAGKLSSPREGAQRSGAQIHLLAEDEGPKGPCPRSSVASITHVLSGDKEVLDVLGVLWRGESSGALDALGWVHTEDGRAGPYLNGSQPLVRWGSFVAVPAGTRPFVILWS